MSKDPFDRNTMANWYAKRHLKTDPGIQKILYLPDGAPDREIRFLEVNTLIADREAEPLEPVDFGVDAGSHAEHRLVVLDITPAQWEKINKRELSLPSGWSLTGNISFQDN